jgi:uncharacterized membrane protein SpoIIM required for sporulation
VSLAPTGLRSERFRDQREADWRELDRLVGKAENKGVRALTDEELLALPVRYRSALSALSTARATSLDKALVLYLESLCARAYFFVYGVRGKPLERLIDYLARGLPAAMKDIWKETLASAALLFIGMAVGWALVAKDPDWFYAFVGSNLAGGRGPDSTAAELRATLYDTKGKDGLAYFATFLFTNNAGVALTCFSLGFAFAAPTILLLLGTGCMMGAFVGVFVSHGLGVEAAGWMMIHGVTEVSAIILAGAAGLRIGSSVAFPGPRSRLEALIHSGRAGGVVMGGVVIMLFFAGLLEGFGRQLVQADWARFAIAGATAIFWLGYFYLPRREARRG